MSAALRLAKIGPNAVTQMIAALEHELGREPCRKLLRGSGYGVFLDRPPHDMVDELEVIGLHSAVRERLPNRTYRRIERAAGRSTGEYLLTRRIPGIMQAVLRRLPTAMSSRLLLAAIRRHAWTFAGSGRCHVEPGPPVVITITGCALCCGAHTGVSICDYYAGTFERLFSELVDARATAVETDCIANGANACVFRIDWRSEPP